MAENGLKKEPLLRIAKRSDISRKKSWLIRFIAIVIALVVCGLYIFSITKQNPIAVYGGLIDGAIGTQRRVWNTLKDTMMLLAVSLAITPAFKMKFWNIGAEGQILVGAIATAAVMRILGETASPAIMFPAMIVLSIVSGLVWGVIPAYFKAKYNTNETLFTLMMNYIAIQLVAFFCIKWEGLKGSGTVGTINQKTRVGWIPNDFLGGIFGKFNYSIILIIVLVLMVLMAVYLNKTKHGYEIAVVGESENTARYAGIDVKKVILRTMALSGALCGLTGFLLVSGSSHTISVNIAGGRGFTAIIVSWLAKFNPYIMLAISFMLAFLDKGAIQIASQFGVNESAAEVMTGIILFFLIGCEFFINYRVVVRGKSKEA